jgi:NAD-dependent SIR2 family protein deacetylase
MDKIDLVIIIGTALSVAPFNKLPDKTKKSAPKVLFNLKCPEIAHFGELDNSIFIEGKCDETIVRLCHEVGWY